MLPSCSRVLVTYAKYVGARTREPGYSTGDEGSLQQDPPQRGTGKARGTPPIITAPIIAAVSNVSRSRPAALQRAAHVPRHEWHYPGFQHILPLLEAALLGRILSSAQLTWLSAGSPRPGWALQPHTALFQRGRELMGFGYIPYLRSAASLKHSTCPKSGRGEGRGQ